MIRTLSTSLTFLFLLLSFGNIDAAVLKADTDTANVLVIKKIKRSKSKKRRTFKVGESITYGTKKSIVKSRGQIQAIEKNHIVVVDDNGNKKQIEISQLTYIRGKFNIVAVLVSLAMIYLGIIVAVIAVTPFIAASDGEPIGIGFTLLWLFSTPAYATLVSLLSRRVRAFSLDKDKWKAEVEVD